jgi:hypothetical protein
MKRFVPFATALFVPVAAFALNFTDTTIHDYTDAPFPQPVAAAVSVLTRLGAVQGNPDGTFAPDRPVNRAEFLKILFKSNESVIVTQGDAQNCFPDVHASDWFSSYVCLAQVRNTVSGYPDGFFRPANVVNYAEALKMLNEMYGNTSVCLLEDAFSGCNEYKTYSADTAWYVPYVDAAAAHGLLLPGRPAYDTPLTRGQVAQLAAAYRAWHDGELPQYRAFERGEVISSSAGSSQSSGASANASNQSVSSQISSNISSASSVSSASSASSVPLFPAISRFLIVGTRTPLVFDGKFTSPDEDAVIRIVEVTLRQEVKSILSMTLLDSTGKDIGTLTLSTDNNTENRKWRLVIPDNNGYKLLKGVPASIGVALNLRPRLNGGIANELMDGIDSFSMTVNGLSTNGSRNLVPAETHYPVHQTADGHITAVRNAGSGSYAMKIGSDRILGKFAISGETTTGGLVSLSSMEFTLQSTDALVSNIRIGGPSPVQQADCGIDTVQASHVICSNIPDEFKAIGRSPLIITVYGDVGLRTGSTAGALQIIFAGRGQVGQNGAIRWQDGIGKYNWLESIVPLENGTMWTVGQ